MATFKQLSPGDISTTKSTLNQLVDIIESDCSGSANTRKYQVFVTGTVLGPGVTSSLYQTCHDQDHSLQSSNPLFDMAVALASGSNIVSDACTGQDSAGKLLFPSSTLMMREKIDIYSQHAKLLLGDSTKKFRAPINSTSKNDDIDAALFLDFKRLFSRDGIRENTFAIKLAATGCLTDGSLAGAVTDQNLTRTANSGTFYRIFTDSGVSTNTSAGIGGTFADIVDASDTNHTVGNIFYESGVVVLDAEKVFSGSQHISGTISIANPKGTAVIGSDEDGQNRQAKLIPDLWVSASCDDIIDHVRSTRLGSGSDSCMTFQNNTFINSTLYFARLTADEFNYSSNPTYVDGSTNKIRVIESGLEDSQKAFSYITTIGLYDASDDLLAVAKVSRPIEKNDEKDVTIRVRLDF